MPVSHINPVAALVRYRGLSGNCYSVHLVCIFDGALYSVKWLSNVLNTKREALNAIRELKASGYRVHPGEWSQGRTSSNLLVPFSPKK